MEDNQVEKDMVNLVWKMAEATRVANQNVEAPEVPSHDAFKALVKKELFCPTM